MTDNVISNTPNAIPSRLVHQKEADERSSSNHPLNNEFLVFEIPRYLSYKDVVSLSSSCYSLWQLYKETNQKNATITSLIKEFTENKKIMLGLLQEISQNCFDNDTDEEDTQTNPQNKLEPVHLELENRYITFFKLYYALKVLAPQMLANTSIQNGLIFRENIRFANLDSVTRENIFNEAIRTIEGINNNRAYKPNFVSDDIGTIMEHDLMFLGTIDEDEDNDEVKMSVRIVTKNKL